MKATCTCARCGIKFARYTSDIRTERVYCTPECQYEGITTKYKKPNTRCAACGVPFHIRNSLLAKKNYCKNEPCRTKRQMVTVNCAVCGTEFERAIRGVREGRMYCTERCNKKAARRRKQGLPVTLQRTTYYLADSVVKINRPPSTTSPEQLLQIHVPTDPLNFLLTRNWNEQHAIRTDDGVDEYQAQGTGEHQGT